MYCHLQKKYLPQCQAPKGISLLFDNLIIYYILKVELLL